MSLGRRPQLWNRDGKGGRFPSEETGTTRRCNTKETAMQVKKISRTGAHQERKKRWDDFEIGSSQIAQPRPAMVKAMSSVLDNEQPQTSE
ncbi:hypothetical protein JMJ77_0007509 [Colletotrichum scovillei]|uniref:Uncharacterized protein n=1 Tax=Colletotrichum scovillei TaxID=1209932 RepID=A0A9P7RD52_9PEZI|nr:hypothetical protein JMJ77_0007509 [Colletotrichum scovillei]KAG7074485.1 hypothetical protein JMJ76_0010963 [Colletotrichum scovillei]KAG7081609.1 hypothetical protein JMJ78_0003727 [Colletotrichum scovillei]